MKHFGENFNREGLFSTTSQRMTAIARIGSGILRCALNDTRGDDTKKLRANLWRRFSVAVFLLASRLLRFFYDDDYDLCAESAACFAHWVGAVSAF